MARKWCSKSKLRHVFRSGAIRGEQGDRKETSPWVRAALRQLSHISPGIALDIPSGRGRHSRLLIELGFRVVAADLDRKAILDAASQSLPTDSLLWVQLD